MYVKKKEYLVSDVNIWNKNGKVGGVVEYVVNGKILKLFLWEKEEIVKFFNLNDFPSSEKELKELRKELKNEYVGKKLKVAEVFGFRDIFSTFDTIK